jgi:hypothetical protein
MSDVPDIAELQAMCDIYGVAEVAPYSRIQHVQPHRAIHHHSGYRWDNSEPMCL